MKTRPEERFDSILVPSYRSTRKRWIWWLAANTLCLGLFLGDGVGVLGQTPLTTLEYRIIGTRLRVSPIVLSVPKGIAGSLLVELVGGGSTQATAASALTNSTFVEATLRGPSFPARRLVGQVNQALLLPPLPLVGDYQLDNIRLVDGLTGETKMEGAPSRVPVRVFDEVLVSRVTSRPLTLDEIRERGIVIDESNFRAVEFEVGFVLDGKTIPVRFPVVAPTFKQSTEIIPSAELDRRLVEADALNRELASAVLLPDELQASRLNLTILPVNFQLVDIAEQDLALAIPPIPALVVIPGNIGFLNQFFSVQIFTENAAPAGSGLSVNNVKAQLVLPPGPDQTASTNYSVPGDDPLRFARVGPDKVVEPIQRVLRPGADGKVGTGDDVFRLFPGESGQGEFLVEGLQEGLHVMDLELTADLEGLAAGIVKVKGKAAGSVLVRNPKFSISFTHPRTIRSGEPYVASVTVLNTSQTVANLVRVTLPATSLSGAVLESEATVEIGTILPGESATARYHLRAQRTGAISFSNLTTSDEATAGRFTLTMGVDERGVVLSPDTIALPDYVNDLPERIRIAAERVLGQALSVATAPVLPPGVKGISRNTITRRALELAEAGQRVRYGDALNRVLADLLLDWQGGRQFNAGFDQIILQTDAGREWREALAIEIELADASDAATRLAERAADFAGRSESWFMAAVDIGDVELRAEDGGVAGDAGERALPWLAGYRGTRGSWLVGGPSTSNAVFRWTFTNATPLAVLRVLAVATNGQAQQFTGVLSNQPAGACASFALPLASGSPRFQLDNNCDGSIDASLVAAPVVVREDPPQVLAVLQDGSVNAGRPARPCFPQVPSLPANYGTVLAVLFSKPMPTNGVAAPSDYSLENGNMAGSVQIQPGGRVALLNMRQPVGSIIPRQMTVSGVTDARGNAVSSNVLPVQAVLDDGVAIRGQVVRGDGSPASGVPVTLTMYDRETSGLACADFIVRVSQVFADTDGFFTFDFVLAGVAYSISATDTTGLSLEAVQILLESTAAAGDEFARNKLSELAASQAVQDTLLASLNVTVLPQAIAKVEGLDRALLRDLVPLGSGRIGSTVPVALRFRGRGAVTGTVVAADGVTPRAGAAVNLFPDPTSRELGRGIFSDSSGRFAFYGVPLGVFSIEAATDDGLSRVVSDSILTAGETRDLPVVLSAAPVVRTTVSGRVTENDNVTPHAGAQVYLGQLVEGNSLCCVVAQATTDADGFWQAASVVVDKYDIVAISQDGKRRGDRQKVTLGAGGDTFVSLALQGRAAVVGRVETSTGQPVTGALVAGGEGIVRTDANGAFTLPGVPTGRRMINAAVERTTDLANPKSNPAFDFPRFGSMTLDVLPGGNNVAIIRLAAVGSIVGRVLDASGNPVPNAQVIRPVDNGFEWIDADAGGNFQWENLGLDRVVTLSTSAQGAPTAKTDVSGILNVLRDTGSSEGELKAAIGEAVNIFTGANDPFLNGAGAAFDPTSFGFIRETLRFDGHVIVSDIRLRPTGRIAGWVLNGQGVPIGAKVRLSSEGLLANGMPATVLRGDINSDPALGTFTFDNVPVGSWGLQCASPFFPQVITASGQTSSTDRDATNLVLQFPAAREVNGRLGGMVFLPDGVTPAGGGVKVRISFGDLEITTETNGTFDTRFGLPALGGDGRPGVGYRVEALDLINGLKGLANVLVMPTGSNTVQNFTTVRLLGRGALRVNVVQASGQPAAGARVEIQQGSYPNDRFEGTADADGLIVFQNLFEGGYGLTASFASGPTTLMGRTGAGVLVGQTHLVMVALGPTATVRGTFVKRDLLTPVGFAQVAIGNIGFATADANGIFEAAGLPLGTYRLVSSDPISGRGAVANVTLNVAGEVRPVQLVEQSLGEITGAVLDGYGTAFVSGAKVTLRVNDGFTQERSVTTGPDGRFRFPGTPAGPFALDAADAAGKYRGSIARVLAENATTLDVTIALTPLALVPIAVVLADGVTPATNATVLLSDSVQNFASDTGTDGRVAFADVPLGGYTLRAASRDIADSRNVGQTPLEITAQGGNAETLIRLPGVGRIDGTVVASDGVTPLAAVTVVLGLQSPLFTGVTEFTLTDGAGQFQFANVPIGGYQLQAEEQALAATASGDIANHAEVDVVNLRLGASGSVIGRLTRADGTTGMDGAEVLLSYQSASSLPGRAVERTGADGRFRFDGVPLRPFALEAVVASVNGIARIGGVVTGNGEIVNLGVVRLDESDPFVQAVFPANTDAAVPITSPIELQFSEAMASNSLSTNGIYMRLAGATSSVPAAVQLAADTNGIERLVRLLPSAPLQSLKTYEIVAIDNERRDAIGGIIASGPRDLAGRPLAAPFLSTFTTADGDPPVVISVFPSDNALQVDPRSIPRLAFNEPVRASNFTFIVTGPGGPIAGTAAVVLHGMAMAFTPAAGLRPNTTYTLSVEGIRDLAGNLARNQPITATFVTLDTLGPDILTLRLATNQAPVALATVSLEALLAVNEPGAMVRFTQDFNQLGTDTQAPFTVSATLPATGSTTIRAIASDRFGNDGPLAELVVNVVTIDVIAPTVSITRPAAGGVLDQPIAVVSTDNSTPYTVEVNLSGALVATQTVTVTASANTPVTNLFAFNLSGAPTNGGTVTATAIATDARTNTATASRKFQLPDLRPPQLVSVTPTNGAVRQSLWPAFAAFDFDEPLAANSVNASSVIVTNSAGLFNAVTLTLANAGQQLQLALARPLWPGTTYTNTLLPGFADVQSNRWQDTGGGAVPAEGVPFIFTTAAILDMTPTNGATLLAGQAITASVSYEPGLGAAFFRFAIGGGDSNQVVAGVSNASAALIIPSVSVTTQLVLHITASDDATFTAPLAFAPVTLNVRPPGGDTDGDGMPDDYETANNLDPFARDADRDPDNDGLTNLQEFQLGTNPHLGDTDGDAILDGTDPHPLAANQRPVALPSLSTNTTGTVTLTLGGSDPDGDTLLTRLTGLPAVGRVFATSDGVTMGVAITNVPALASGAPPRVVYQPVGVASTNQLRYLVNDGFTNSTEAVITLISTNNPASDVDGDDFPDGYELANGLDPFVNDAALDLDGDTLSNQREFTLGTAPNRRDTDADGLDDAAEVALGTRPLNPDTDNDGILDGVDPDPFTSNGDFDGDGIADVDDLDIDGDGLANADELTRGTNARKPDTDGDGWRDGVEVEVGTDPALAGSVPVLFHVAAPTVGLVLPISPELEPSTFGLTVGQPAVGLVLPASPQLTEIALGLTVGQPAAGLVLPANPELDETAFGLTMGQPVVGLVLPASPLLSETNFGLTVGQPQVGLILPASPDLDSGVLGLTVAQPVVFLRFDIAPSGSILPGSVNDRMNTASGSGANRTDLALRLEPVAFAEVAVASILAMDPASGRQSVLLQWTGPAQGTYTIEASTDLQIWTPVPTQTISSENGTYRVHCEVLVPAVTFYRLRYVP